MLQFLIELLGYQTLVDEGLIFDGKPSSKLLRIAKDYNIKIDSANDNDIVEIAEYILSLELPTTKSGGKVPFKPNKTDLIAKLKSFFTKYQYDVELVKNKIESYIKRCLDNPSEYNTALKYYIMKDGYSLLADDCENEDEEERITPYKLL